MSADSEAGIPAYRDLLLPTLRAVIAMDGSGRIDEINSEVIECEGYSEEQQGALHKDGPQSEIEYRLAWARTYLKGMSLLDNSARGVWSVTEEGRNVDPEEIDRRHDEYTQRTREKARLTPIFHQGEAPRVSRGAVSSA